VSSAPTGVGSRRPLGFTALARRNDTSGRPAAFLDRDGVLNEAVRDPTSKLPESPLDVADVRLLAGAAAAARQLVDAGYVLVCVSNQPAAAKGKVAVERLIAVHEQVVELLAGEGVSLDAWRLCPHHPDGVVQELSGPCGCRKPAPGMLLDAAAALELDVASSWMLGDTESDVAAGLAAGCRTALITYPGSAHKRTGLSSPDVFAADLPAAVAQLLDRGPVKLVD
jgi:D-glycero-D-manno-heptose 1,7-bisphosphate phosphatase